MKDFESMEYERMEMELVPLQSAIDLGRYKHEFRRVRDYDREHLILKLDAFFAGKEHRSSCVVEAPDTWWDHLKLRFLPTWIYVIYPARMRKIYTETHTTYICPHIETASWQGLREHVVFLQQKPNSSSRE